MVKSYILKSCMMSVNFRFGLFKHKLLAEVKLWMFKKITAASSARQIQLFTRLARELLLLYLKAQIVTIRFLASMQPNYQPILRSWKHKKSIYTQQYQAARKENASPVVCLTNAGGGWQDSQLGFVGWKPLFVLFLLRWPLDKRSINHWGMGTN